MVTYKMKGYIFGSVMKTQITSKYLTSLIPVINLIFTVVCLVLNSTLKPMEPSLHTPN